MIISGSYENENVILYIRCEITYLKIKQSIMNRKRKEIIKNTSLSHRESMRKSLNNRLESARATGNSKLIEQLEAEAKYLHL